MADDTEMEAALADAATGCAAALGDGGSGCPRGEAGLDCAAESGVRHDGGDEDGFGDCWALALNVSSNEAVISQCDIRIAKPRFCLCLRRALRKLAVLLVAVLNRPLLAGAPQRCMMQAWRQCRAASKNFFNYIVS